MLSIATGEASPLRVIQIQRARLFQQLHTITTQRIAVNPKEDLAHLMLLDSVVMHLEADVRWLDMVEARLEEVKKQPMPEPEMKPRGRPRKE